MGDGIWIVMRIADGGAAGGHGSEQQDSSHMGRRHAGAADRVVATTFPGRSHTDPWCGIVYWWVTPIAETGEAVS